MQVIDLSRRTSAKMTLQGPNGGLGEVEILEELDLLRGHPGDAGVGGLADHGAVFLNASEQLQSAGRAEAGTLEFDS